ncbi:hypothetical protein DFH07DRAFT_957159 [Mycena maculata]|uniref:Bacteriophage T5 Orf172 DNA-binding domain-containing protein n=1 Tax=Mycena maculata TaxID=230809 RepID=A0AAD7NI92_9AGAR|nr:hypothetical protein DFH07DRAFT_957159 [Mycena maculata]
MTRTLPSPSRRLQRVLRLARITLPRPNSPRHRHLHPIDRAMTLLTLDQPYKKEGPGRVYINYIVADEYVSTFKDGLLTLDELIELDTVRVKVGSTDDMRRRQPEYRRRCEKKGKKIWWWRSFSADRRMAIEHMVHFSLESVGAGPRPFSCKCGVEHREYFSLKAAGGFLAVEQMIHFWINGLGQTTIDAQVPTFSFVHG